ncbi:MAG: hypothetical protein WC702_03235 [Patescibacteria group bacterium]
MLLSVVKFAVFFQVFLRKFERRSGQQLVYDGEGLSAHTALAGISHNKGRFVMAPIVTGEQYYDLDGQLTEIKRQLRQRGGYPFSPAQLSLALQAIIEGRFEDSVLEVNYDLAFEAMVAAGHYNCRDMDVTAEHFPNKSTGVIKYEPVLVYLGRASTNEALHEIEQLGVIPASAAELLAYGAKCPEEQRNYPIVALGQAWRRHGRLFFPCLYRGDRERRLYIDHGADDWDAHCRFLALRKVS